METRQISVSNENSRHSKTHVKLVDFKKIIASDISENQDNSELLENLCEQIIWAKDTIAPPSGLLRPLHVKKVSNGYRVIGNSLDYLALRKVHGQSSLTLKIPVTLVKDPKTKTGVAKVFSDAKKTLQLFDKGFTVKAISELEEKSELGIQQHMALAKLPIKIQEASSNGYLPLRAASALTLVPDQHKKLWYEAFSNGESWTTSEDGIKTKFSNHLLRLEDAIFAPKKYKGRYLEDWFDHEISSHFEDRPQFWKLQLEALTKKEKTLLKLGWKCVLVHAEGQPCLEYNYQTIYDLNPFKCAQKEIDEHIAMIHIYKCGYVDFSVAKQLP